jgi:AcrR family transcriptional regulator
LWNDDGMQVMSRRERQREETRRDLARAALELATEHGLANVRVPDIAAAAGVSTRTFNNYFPSKEAAIAWPTTERATLLAEGILARPADEPIGEALIEAFVGYYRDGADDEWLQDFRALAVREPALQGEVLKAADATERALARAITARLGERITPLAAAVAASSAVGAERAAVMSWVKAPEGSLVDTVGEAIRLVINGIGGTR